MDINAVFPSKYITSSDLQGKEVPVCIDHVQMEQMQDGKTVPVLYFQGKQKGLVLNKGNSKTIADLYGSETDNWTGRTLTLFTIWTEFQGKAVQGLRVRGTTTHPGHVPIQGAPPPIPQAAPPTQEQAEELTNEYLDDQIPF